MERENTRGTLLTLTGALLVLYLIFPSRWLLYPAVVLALSGAFFPKPSAWIAAIWLRFSEVLGFVISRLLLALVYFVVLCPAAWLYRLFSKDPLQLKKSSAASFYHPRNHTYVRGDLEKPW